MMLKPDRAFGGKIREIGIDTINYQCETLRVPMDNYGSVLAALVFYPEN